MKILCLQLARYGDIYQTWPTLNALRRIYPESTIDFLVREKFADACIGLDQTIHVKQLSSKAVLGPLFHNDIPGAQAILNQFVEELKSNKYDKIINLSFSPSSSYLVELISNSETIVTGYTRFSDGHLCLPDDASSYFYAQVGVDKSNRIHLSDIFALIAGVELQKDDFKWDESTVPQFNLLNGLKSFFVVHLGASNPAKTCKPEVWVDIVSKILKNHQGSAVLIGAESENIEHADFKNNPRVINLCGKTRLSDVFTLLSRADALLGGDSVLLHMASLTQTPTLNLSFSCVNFWETGPRAYKSRILFFSNNENVNTDLIAQEAQKLIQKLPAGESVIEMTKDFGVLYEGQLLTPTTFEWELTKSLYMNSPFPKSEDVTIDLGMNQLKEIAVTALEQIGRLQNENMRSLAVQLLDQTDILMQRISNLVPEISPLIRWFQTEKTRIPPANLSQITSRTKELYEKLVDICQLYTITNSFEEILPREELNWKS